MAAAAPAAAASLPPDLSAAASAYDAAQVAGDRGALERLLADDYRLANSGGQVQDKASFIADSVKPGFKLDPFTVREPIEIVWADGAVLGGVAVLSGTDGGRRFSVPLRFADVWARRGGRWQVVYTQAAHAPAAP